MSNTKVFKTRCCICDSCRRRKELVILPNGQNAHSFHNGISVMVKSEVIDNDESTAIENKK